MVFGVDHRRPTGRFLEGKVALFASGAVLGLAGILVDEVWLRVGAIVLLVSAMLLRFLPGAGGTDPHPVGEAGEAEEDHDGGPEARV